MTAFDLTYCANVHPAAQLDAVLDSVGKFTTPIAASRRAAGHGFGMGAWWNEDVAKRLAHSAPDRDRLRQALAGVPVWTLNVFPQSVFHDEPVKTRVYSPDWSTEARLRFTLDAATALARLTIESDADALRRDAYALSTLPLGFDVDGQARIDLDACARRLATAAAALAALQDETGICMVLAIEPEPFCVLERCDQTAEFLQQRVFAARPEGVPETVLRRHLGVCVDFCHLAVMGEDPVRVLRDFHAAGIRVPKLQVSACLELRDPQGALPQLLEFEEPHYLHQTRGASGRRALDLGAVRANAEAWRAESMVHTHFHVPVFWDDEGGLGSTRAQVQRVLGALHELDFVDGQPLLEVETYTYGVLQRGVAGVQGELQELILSELEFVDRALA